MDIEAMALRSFTVHDLPTDSHVRYELIDGSLHVTPNPTSDHQRAAKLIDMALTAALQPGHEALQGINIIPHDLTLAIPDVAVVEEGVSALGYTPAQVVLVVEVLSPSTRLHDLSLKRELYASWGLTYWVVDPVARTITRHGAAYAEVAVPGFVLA
ncbi:MAG: Uma2 family endonuclease [Kineosporiaceae bacterium]